MENLSLSIDQKVDIIMRQTTYTNDECLEYLTQLNGDHINVIKQFLGIKPKQSSIKSVNQEIYKQIRYKLDSSMKEYNNKNPTNMADVVDKLG